MHAFFTRKPFDLKFLSRVCTNACLMSGCKRWGFSLFSLKKWIANRRTYNADFFFFRKLLLVCPTSQKTRFNSIIEFMIEFYAQFRGRSVFFFKQHFFTFKSTFFGGRILSFFSFSGVYPGAISGPSTVAAPPHNGTNWVGGWEQGESGSSNFGIGQQRAQPTFQRSLSVLPEKYAQNAYAGYNDRSQCVSSLVESFPFVEVTFSFFATNNKCKV